MGKMIVILVILIVVVIGAILLVTLWPSEEQLRRRSRRRSVVIEEARVEAASENYRLLERYHNFVAQLLLADADFPILREHQRQHAQVLVDEFTEDRRDK